MNVFRPSQSLRGGSRSCLARAALSSQTSATKVTSSSFPRAAFDATPARAKSTTAQESSLFSFLPTNKLPVKPRQRARTEIRAAYYSPLGPRYLSDILETYGSYVDGIKFAGGSFTLQPVESLKKVIDLAHDNGVYVSTGGYLEKILSSSNGDKALVERYLKACKEVGFDVLEISSGFLSLPENDWKVLVDLVQKHGLKAKPEIGIQFGAGGDTSAAELEAAGTRDAGWLIGRAKTFLDAGADTIMIESEGITENVNTWRTDVISQITSSLPLEKVMFEAADPAVFQYYIQNFGADVNLFVDHSQIVQLACLRRGIWGTNSTFGRIVTFPEDQK